jgi:hypothetical protein
MFEFVVILPLQGSYLLKNESLNFVFARLIFQSDPEQDLELFPFLKTFFASGWTLFFIFQVFYMLKSWRDREGANAHSIILEKALRSSNMNDIAMLLQP